jgi:hypothetical protein
MAADTEIDTNLTIEAEEEEDDYEEEAEEVDESPVDTDLRPAAVPTHFRYDGSPVIGVKRLRGEAAKTAGFAARNCRDQRIYGRELADLPEGTQVWRITRDEEDLRLPDPEFIPIVDPDDPNGPLDAVRARFPGPGSGRVEFHKEKGAYNRNGGWDYKPPSIFIVHALPFVDDPDVETLVELTSAHGDVLVSREEGKRLRESREYDDCDLVVAEITGSPYAYVKYRPSKARARTTKANNDVTKAQRALDLAEAAARMRLAVDRLSGAIRGDLSAFKLAHVLVDDEDSHRADDYEKPKTRRGRYRGYCNRDESTKRLCVTRLTSFVKIHEAFRGVKQYRRLAAWAEMRAAWKQLPKDLEPHRWGLKEAYCPDNTAWWAVEMAAKAPRPKITKAEEPTDADAEDR